MMTEYAIVDNGTIIEFREFAEAPVLGGKPYRKILPTEYVTPEFDPASEVPSGEYLDDVQADKVVRTAVIAALPPAIDPPLALQQVACARLVVDGWDVTGVERSEGLSLAFVADTDTVWAFFNEPQPDTYYVVTPDDGVTKHEDYIEITRPGLAAINLVVSRVQ